MEKSGKSDLLVLRVKVRRYTEYTYEPFVERKPAIGVKHVFAWPRDEFHTADISREPAPHLEYSISYEQWLAGERPSKWIESFYCPFDVFSSEIFAHLYENPCSRCDKCRKKHPRRYKCDKAECWAEVRDKMKNGETFPKYKEK